MQLRLYLNALSLIANVRESLEIAANPRSCWIVRDCSQQLASTKTKTRGTIANGRPGEGKGGCTKDRGAEGKEKSQLRGEIYERRVRAR